MRFQAPWSKMLMVISVLSTVILVGVSGLLAAVLPWEGGVIALLPLTVLVGTALYTVRGYEIQGRELLVQRLLWSTRVPLEGLSEARVEPDVMAGSWRLFGNGGMFSFTGLFRNKRLGTYRAWATSGEHAVVLKLADRTVVVTPDDPGAFVERLGLAGRA